MDWTSIQDQCRRKLTRLARLQAMAALNAAHTHTRHDQKRQPQSSRTPSHIHSIRTSRSSPTSRFSPYSLLHPIRWVFSHFNTAAQNAHAETATNMNSPEDMKAFDGSQNNHSSEIMPKSSHTLLHIPSDDRDQWELGNNISNCRGDVKVESTIKEEKHGINVHQTSIHKDFCEESTCVSIDETKSKNVPPHANSEDRNPSESSMRSSVPKSTLLPSPIHQITVQLSHELQDIISFASSFLTLLVNTTFKEVTDQKKIYILFSRKRDSSGYLKHQRYSEEIETIKSHIKSIQQGALVTLASIGKYYEKRGSLVHDYSKILRDKRIIHVTARDISLSSVQSCSEEKVEHDEANVNFGSLDRNADVHHDATLVLAVDHVESALHILDTVQRNHVLMSISDLVDAYRSLHSCSEQLAALLA